VDDEILFDERRDNAVAAREGRTVRMAPMTICVVRGPLERTAQCLREGARYRNMDGVALGAGKLMRRRDFIATLGLAAVSAWARGARAQAGAAAGTAPQSSNAPLVGFLNSASAATYRFNADSFREGLKQAGFIEGQNVRIEERWANGDYQALPVLAAELVANGVVAIAATGDVASARAARDASTTVPVVFTVGGDPVRFGLVASFNRPGGHVTGIMFASNVLGAKRVQLLHEMVPNIRRVALLMNPDNPNAPTEQADAQAGAAQLDQVAIVFNARNSAEIDTAFAELLRAKCDAIVTATDPVMLDRREQIAALAERNSLPAVSFTRPFAAAGGLMSYGPSIGGMYREAGGYIGKILKGAKPADLPVIQLSKFELVINLKTAKALRLTIPPNVLTIADEVIE
jgi:putative tryptophan/tyrosine transport system substrate-binding protein